MNATTPAACPCPDLENLLSPALVAALLTVIAFNTLFAGTVTGFLCSALLVVSVHLPSPAAAAGQSFYASSTDHQRQVFAGSVVDNGEDAEAPPIRSP